MFALQLQVQVLRVVACFSIEDGPGLFADSLKFHHGMGG